ncbi:MAG: DUF1353 domain-containing protein [Prosthecobacter sp.]
MKILTIIGGVVVGAAVLIVTLYYWLGSEDDPALPEPAPIVSTPGPDALAPPAPVALNPSPTRGPWGYFLVDGKEGADLITSLGAPAKGGVTEPLGTYWTWTPVLNLIQNELVFVDPENRKWTVPKNSINDGASVPQFVQFIIPGGLNCQARFAAIVHDRYCEVESVRIHEQVDFPQIHLMFYFAMRASAVDSKTAKLMYACVRKFGPPNSRSLISRMLAQSYPSGSGMPPSLCELLEKQKSYFEPAGIMVHMEGAKAKWGRSSEGQLAFNLCTNMEQIRSIASRVASIPNSVDPAMEDFLVQASKSKESLDALEKKSPSVVAAARSEVMGSEDETGPKLQQWLQYVADHANELEIKDIDRLVTQGIPAPTAAPTK